MNSITNPSKTGNPVVDALTPLRLEGNIIHFEWLHHPIFMRTEGGRGSSERKREATVNLLAVVVYADIIYWFRATPILDGESGQILGYRKRFTGEKFEWDYKKRAARFGCTERQLKDAIAFLEERGLIRREIERPSNRVFIEPDVELAWEISYSKLDENVGSRLNVGRPPFKREPEHIQPEAAPRLNGGGGTDERGPYLYKNIQSENPLESTSESGLIDDRAKLSEKEEQTLSDEELSKLLALLINHRLQPTTAITLVKRHPERVAQVPAWWATVDKSKIRSEAAAVRSFVEGKGHWADWQAETKTAAETKSAPSPQLTPEQVAKVSQRRESQARITLELLPPQLAAIAESGASEKGTDVAGYLMEFHPREWDAAGRML